MDRTGELKKSLSKYFDFNKARLDCLARILLSLFAVRTVNLKQIALGFASKSVIDSRYRRLQRFFAQFKWDYSVLARWLFYGFFDSNQKVYLIVDRTNWFWGKSKINILMLSVAYEGLAIPLFWQMLNKAGNATAKEHSEIIERYVKLFGKENILGVLGDREFASGALFNFFSTQDIPFYIRIKGNACITVGRQKVFTAEKVFSHLNSKDTAVFGAAVMIYGRKVYLSGSRSERGELMIIATLKPCKNAIPIYLRRWEIENLFQGLKSRGFQFEDTHLTHPERISTLIAVVSVAFCWAHKIGEFKALTKPIIFKYFRHQQRPQYSYFHYGLDHLREILLNPLKRLYRHFRPVLRLLTLPLSKVKLCPI